MKSTVLSVGSKKVFLAGDVVWQYVMLYSTVWISASDEDS